MIRFVTGSGNSTHRSTLLLARRANRKRAAKQKSKQWFALGQHVDHAIRTASGP